jgi:hypothetical protein
MVFLVQSDCKCCKEFLHHCWTCWRDHHNGARDNDYVPPRYYGEPMSEDFDKALKEMGIEQEIPRTIIADRKKPYNEGEYH